MASQVEHLDVGTKISFYEVLQLEAGVDGKPPRTCVGSGGFGATYKVGRGSKVYALKLALQPLSSYSAEDRQWIEERGDREIAALKSLRHPNIVRVHAFDRWPDEDGHGFIVMDFVDGNTLDEWRIRSAPSLRRICEATRSIALALQVAHKQQIFHRDLKSSNVLVRVDGEPVIVDWGLARPASTYSITQGAQMVGTYTCFSPEYCRWAFAQTKVRFEWTAPTELYVVGYMLFELLTGRPPYKRQADDVAMMREITTAEVPLPSSINPEVPANLDELVLNLLDKEPSNRIQSGEALAQRLFELLAAAGAEWDRPLGIAAPLNVAATRADRAGKAGLSKNELPPAPPKENELPPPPPRENEPIPTTEKLEPRPKMSLASMHKPAFIPAETPELAEAKDHAGSPRAASAVLAAEAKLRTLGTGRRAVPPFAIVSGVVALALIAIVALASLGKRDANQKGEDLLASVQRDEALSRDAGAPRVAKDVPAPSRLPPPAPDRTAGNDSVDGSAAAAKEEHAPPLKREKPPSDAADIDRQLSERFGRPTVRPDGTLEHAVVASPAQAQKAQPAAQKSSDDDVPDWLKPIQSAPPDVSTLNKPLGIPSGTHIRARLETNLDSRTVGDGPIEAKLMRPLYVETHAILPAGTVLLGHAQVSGARFTIHFYRLRLPSMREVPFEGLAYDTNERKPGLPPSRLITSEAPKQDGVATKIAKGTADALLAATSTGGLPSTLVAGAGQTALNNSSDQGQQQTQSGQVLLLDAGMDFDAFIASAF